MDQKSGKNVSLGEWIVVGVVVVDESCKFEKMVGVGVLAVVCH